MKLQPWSQFRIATWIISFFVMISVLYPAIMAPIASASAAKEFEQEFSSNYHGDMIGGLTLDERAEPFQGCFGLEALERLSIDPNLKPEGRKAASNIRDEILNGGFQDYLGARLQRHWYKWPGSCWIAYIYLLDGLKTGHWKVKPGSPNFFYGIYYN